MGMGKYKPTRVCWLNIYLKSNLLLLFKFGPADLSRYFGIHSKSALAVLACGFSAAVGFSWQVYCTGWSMLNPIGVKILFGWLIYRTNNTLRILQIFAVKF